MSRTTHSRGQSLVLFSGFLLMLTLLVLTTLSLGHLERTKMEMQVAADTAAYSQAVATARAFNSVALLNRAQVATMVALAGVAGAVSFAGTYRGALNAVYYSYVDEVEAEYCGTKTKLASGTDPSFLCNGSEWIQSDCSEMQHGTDPLTRSTCFGKGCMVSYYVFGWGKGPGGAKNNPNARLPLLRNEMLRVRAVWNNLDNLAGLQSFNIIIEAGKYSGLERTALAAASGKFLSFGNAALAPANAQLMAPTVGISQREFADGWAGGSTENSIEAAMGSRAHPFTNARADAERAIATRIRKVLQPSGGAREVAFNLFTGNSYFASSKNHGARAATNYAAYGDEESSVSVDYSGPDRFVLNGHVGASGNNQYMGFVRSTDQQNTGDNHQWCPTDFAPEASPPDVRHTLPPHQVPPPPQVDLCAGSSCIWPSYLDANAGRLLNAGDAFGQPKLMAGAKKDLSTDTHPWNLAFRFRASAAGPGATVDYTSQHAIRGVTPSMESLSAAMAYYHRPGHWKEPPNLFNPYWRATLVRANVDDPGLADSIAAASGSNKSAMLKLQAVGYSGVP